MDQNSTTTVFAGPSRPTASIRRSIVIPMYRERERLPPTIEAISRSPLNRADTEFLFVDDGSDDGSAATAAAGAEQWGLGARVIRFERNRGKGAAVAAGMLAAAGPVRVFMDADLSTDIDDVVACFRCLEQDAADVVVATRSHPDSRIDHRRPSLRAWSGWSYNLVLRALGLTRLRDTQCGLKGFTAAAAEVCFRELRVAGFAFDIEVLSRADHAGLRILESPVGWAHVPESRVNAVRDAPKMVRDTLGVWRAHRRVARVGEPRLPSLRSDGVILDLTEPQTDPVGGPIIEASPVRAAGF